MEYLSHNISYIYSKAIYLPVISNLAKNAGKNWNMEQNYIK